MITKFIRWLLGIQQTCTARYHAMLAEKGDTVCGVCGAKLQKDPSFGEVMELTRRIERYGRHR